jgi:hypothetical protein
VHSTCSKCRRTPKKRKYEVAFHLESSPIENKRVRPPSSPADLRGKRKYETDAFDTSPLANKRSRHQTDLDDLLDSFSEDLTVSQDSVSKLSAWNPELDNWGKSRDEAALQDFYSWEFANQPPLMLFPVQLRQRHGNGMAVVAGVPIQVVPPLPPPLDIGEMDQLCRFCRARRFLHEPNGIFYFLTSFQPCAALEERYLYYRLLPLLPPWFNS